MDFNIIYKLRDKKNWWVDVVFYFVISSLIATISCYIIFIVKIYIQNKKIEEVQIALTTVGTDQQKEMEKQVFEYQKKINDFSNLIKEHKISSNVFAFVEKYTMPNVWFSKFSVGDKKSAIVLLGETDDMESISRQVSIFEGTEYVRKIELLNTQNNSSGKITFNISLSLDPKIFIYVPVALTEPAASESEASLAPEGREAENTAAQEPVKSSEKIIASFDIISTDPPAIGSINQADHTVELKVPVGTDVANLSPTIVISPKAVIAPASNTPQNFSSAVIYTVTAEDGSTQNYAVSVSAVSPGPVETSAPAQNNNVIVFASALLAVLLLSALAIIIFLLRKKKKNNNKAQIKK